MRARSQESPSQESGVTESGVRSQEEELEGEKNSLKFQKVIGF
ncbi:hypothetical protein [Anabaena sp. AL09]|nr:hypothetical protein [Anabaena sp. AL09]